MALWPGFAAVESIESTTQELVATPDSGTSRLVNMVSFNSNDFGARVVNLHLYDGAEEYILYAASLGVLGASIVPLANTATPIVLENGWNLRFTTDAKTLAEIDVAASYADDTGDGGEASTYHLAGISPPVATAVTLVPEPDEGEVHIVRMMSWSNDDVVVHSYGFAMTDTGTADTFGITKALSAAAGSALMVLLVNQGIVIPHGWKLEAQVFVAEDTNESHLTAHYMTANEHDGEKA